MRAVVSCMNNIAEGYERSSNAEFRRFLYIAKGSMGEVRSMLYLVDEMGYLSKDDAYNLQCQAVEISKMISGLIKVVN